MGEDRDPVAGFEAPIDQPRGKGADAAGQLGVGQLLPPVTVVQSHGRLGTELLGGLGEHRRQVTCDHCCSLRLSAKLLHRR